MISGNDKSPNDLKQKKKRSGYTSVIAAEIFPIMWMWSSWRTNVRQIPGVTAVHTNMFMCSDPGQELIQADIKNGTINRVVVASCAPSLHETDLSGSHKTGRHEPLSLRACQYPGAGQLGSRR